MKYLIILLFIFFTSIFFASADEIEKMEVIGSHIKRTNEGPAPVLVIDKKQIELTGYNSVADVLRDLPISTSGGKREASLSNATTGVSINGMGSNEILLLLNGRRMPNIGGSTSVDLTTIPLSAIEKIEILKDGASAIYGSDALGGVINIKTKKNYVGGQVNLQGSLVQRKEGNTTSGLFSFFDFLNWNDKDNSWDGKGDKINLDASYGGNIKNINYLISSQLKFNSAMYLRDRKFGPPQIDHFSSMGTPGSWSENGTDWNVDPNCPKTRVKKGICKFNYGPYMEFMPQIAQWSLFTEANTEMGNNTLSATAIYSVINSHAILAPPPAWLITPISQFDRNVPGKDQRIPKVIAEKWGLKTKGPIELKYRLVNEKGSGKRHIVTNTNYYQFITGINIPILDTIEFDGYLNIAGTYYKAIGTNGWADKNILMKLAAQNPSGFNPFLPNDKKSDVTPAIYNPVTKTISNLITAEPQFTGEIFSTNNHTVSFATGNLTAFEYYSESIDKITSQNRQWGGGGSSVGSGHRWYSSIYSEFSLMSFEKIELQLATRSDYYNDFGFTKQEIPFTSISIPISPRVALSINPVNEVQLRASWSLGFKAPSLSSVNLKKLVDHPFSLDYVRCEKPDPKVPGCAIGQFEVTKSGNKNIKPELSKSFNVGIVLEPVKNIFFSLDYFRINQSDIVSSASLRDILLYEKKYGAEKLKEIKASVNRDANGFLKTASVTPINQASAMVHGLNSELGFSVPIMNAWSLDVKVDHAYILKLTNKASDKSKTEVYVPYAKWLKKLMRTTNKKSDLEKDAAMYGSPRWRNKTSFAFSNKDAGHQIQFVVHNIPAQKKDFEVDDEINHYWKLDVAGTISINKQTSLILGVTNILGLKPPTNNMAYGSSGYLNSSLYSIRGRTIDAKVTYNF